MILNQWTDTAWSLMTVRNLTLYNYQLKYAKHIEPVFGASEISEISKRDIQLWILNNTPTVGRAALPVLSSIMRTAVEYEIIDRNPCAGVKKKPHSTPNRDFLTMEQLEEYTMPLKRSYRLSALFLASHGLRMSEALAIGSKDASRASETGLLLIDKTIHGPLTKSGKPRSVPYLGGWHPIPRSRPFMQCLPVTMHSLANDLCSLACRKRRAYQRDSETSRTR